jgi:transposase
MFNADSCDCSAAKNNPHQLGHRFSNIPPCLIGMEACSGTHLLHGRS